MRSLAQTTKSALADVEHLSPSYFAMVMSAFSLSQQQFFGAWSSWARGQTPQWSAHAMANTANSALRPYQRRARANARRLSRSRKPG